MASAGYVTFLMYFLGEFLLFLLTCMLSYLINHHYMYSLRDVERRPVLCSFKRIEPLCTQVRRFAAENREVSTGHAPLCGRG